MTTHHPARPDRPAEHDWQARPDGPAGFAVAGEVAAALRDGRPVVALESTILSHGFPHPRNRALADEMLAAVRAKAEGCPFAIALINDPTLVPLMGPLGIDAYINPRATTVSSILRHIRHGRVRGVYSVGDAEAEVIEAEVLSTSPIAGQRIRDIDFPEGVLVGAVLQEGKVMRPTGALRIEEGNVIALFSMTKDVPEVERLLQVSIDFF